MAQIWHQDCMFEPKKGQDTFFECQGLLQTTLLEVPSTKIALRWLPVWCKQTDVEERHNSSKEFWLVLAPSEKYRVHILRVGFGVDLLRNTPTKNVSSNQRITGRQNAYLNLFMSTDSPMTGVRSWSFQTKKQISCQYPLSFLHNRSSKRLSFRAKQNGFGNMNSARMPWPGILYRDRSAIAENYLKNILQ